MRILLTFGQPLGTSQIADQRECWPESSKTPKLKYSMSLLRERSRPSSAILSVLIACLAVMALWPGVGLAQTQLITNGDFAANDAGWQLSGNFFADARFSNCRSCPGYAYVSNADGSPGNTLFG